MKPSTNNKSSTVFGLFKGGIDVWCGSLSHRHFCVKFRAPSKLVGFLIHLVETLLLAVEMYCIEGFLTT